MPFAYGTPSSVKNIDEAGSDMLAAALGPRVVMGVRLQATFLINASGTDAAGDSENVYNKLFSFQLRLYSPQGSSTTPIQQGFKYKTANAIAGAADMQFQTSSNQNEPNRNYSATLEVVSATQVKVVFDFYCTSFDQNYFPFSVNNLNRFLASKNTGGYMELNTGSAFDSGTSGISIITAVGELPLTVPPGPAFHTVTFSGGNERFVPIFIKWFGRNLGSTDFSWILDSFINTTDSGKVIAEKLHRATGQPHQNKYDDNFILSSSSLSPIEDNYITAVFKVAGGTNTSMTSVRAMLLRVDDIDNATQFLNDYEASIGTIPASDTGMGQISGAIHAPASFVNLGSIQCTVKFRIPSYHVKTGARYRVLFVLYSTALPDCFAGVSQELTADDHPEIYPNADIFTADYFQESVLPRGLMGYHSAYQSRIEIQKSSIANAFTYYGLTGSFDSSVSYVKAQVLRPGTESTTILTPEQGPEKFLWMNGAGMLQGQSFTDGATLFEGSFVDFIDEQWVPKAGAADSAYYISVQWEIGVLSTMPNGNPVLLACRYQQKIDARRWESEAGQPTPPSFNLTMTLYRLDEATLIPDGTQFLCGQDEVLALVEKSEDIVGIDAYCIPETYGETTADGNTTDQSIKQRHGTLMGILPASVNPEINAYDALFSLNAVMGSTIDDAGIRVDIRDLGSNQKFWLVALARKVWPNAVPFIADDVPVVLVRDGGDITTITANFLDWWSTLIVDTGSVSPFNFRIVNSVTQNFSCITAGAFNNPSTDDIQIEVTVDHNIYPQLLQIDVIYEIEGTIVVSGENHLVRFMVRKTFDLPTSAGTINDTIVTADWKSVDFDF